MGPISAVRVALALLAWGFLGWSLLAIVHTPTRLLWKPGVAATEWGHWLGWMALLTGLAQLLLDAPYWQIVPVLVASGLFHVPLALSLAAARGVRERLAGLDVEDPMGPGVRQRSPVVVSSLLHIPVPQASPVRHLYGEVDGVPLTLDYYEPCGSHPSSTLVMVVHGGSWTSGDSSQLAGMNRYLAGCGYPVAALNYRLAPRFRFPAPLDDIHAAICYLEEGPAATGCTWERVVLLGRSSGGHLALLAAYTPSHPLICGVIALYAPTDLVWSWQRPSPDRLMDSNGAIRALMGGSPEEMPDRFEAASPLCLVRSDLPPTLLIHGGNDELVSPRQSQRLAAALDSADARYVHIELPWGKHGMDANLAGPSGQITLYAVERFLRAV